MRFDRNNATKIGFPFALLLLFGLVQAQEPARQAGPGASPGAAPAAEPAGGGAPAAGAPAGEAPAAKPLAGTSRVTSPPVGKTAGQSRRTGADPVDDRVELREYYFAETDEWLPYAVFVSSKITKGEKPPLVLALHGYSGNHGTFMRTQCVDEAEKNGYVLVGVMGYSPTAPFGRSMGARGAPGARRGPADPGGAGTPGAPAGPGGAGARGGAPAAGPQPGATAGAQPPRGAAPGARVGMGRGRGTPIGGTKETDPAKVAELSEKDTMYVLEMTRKEFNADENRIYLMGHSMGGAGALYLGEKYAPMWAAVAGLAGFGSPDPQGKMKDTPLYLTAGSLDSLGSGGRTLAERLKAAGMDCEWKEMPGLDHGGIIGGAMPDVFKFFNDHVKGQAKPTTTAAATAPAAAPATGPAAEPARAEAPAAKPVAGTSRVTSPPAGKTAGQSRRTGGDPVDDRVELREYYFAETDEWLPYAVFVSSKITKDKKPPLVLALHGFSGNHGTFMRTQCVDEAEKDGYVLVGAMGYSPSGSFGMPFGMGGRGRGGPGAGGRGGAPGNAPAPSFGSPAPTQDTQPQAPAGRGGAMPGGRGAMPGGRGTGTRGGIGGTAVTDSAKVAELSEKDAMNVLEMVRKEFNVDDNRIYLMGHSLGGGGALHMGEKYSTTWAGVAALAPAAFGFQWTADSKLKDVPLLIVQGEGDTLVQPAGSQRLAAQLKDLKFQCEYKALPGLDHGGIIAGSMPDVFKFFGQHTKGEPKE